jgi:hypothetical protein
MVSPITNLQSVLAPPQAQSQSKSSSPGVSFQQAVAHYTQNTTSGVGGGSSSGSGPTQTLSSGLMSSLLKMVS